MSSCIIVHPVFDGEWPFTADHLHELWSREGDVKFIRLSSGDLRPVGQILDKPEEVTRIVTMGVPVTTECLKRFGQLREAAFETLYHCILEPEQIDYLKQHGIALYTHQSEGFWGQSVSEFALALTLCGLRRIPQLHREIIGSTNLWTYEPVQGDDGSYARGVQFGDDTRFANGTVSGKRVRIVGAGNIASRYASYMGTLGADVAAWDPFAAEPCFHRAGARREHYLDRLVRDADIFAPMLPLTDKTRNLVHDALIRALPQGCLVVLATRAEICDTKALRERVLADELSLAADVFDVEPLPLDDPLLGRHNVVHTPHSAGRTMDGNRQWADMLAGLFRPVGQEVTNWRSSLLNTRS